MPIPSHARISALARSPSLLIACDFDGTTSPLVDDPENAALDPRCRAALQRLSSLPQTTVAFVSGRPLMWLRGATSGLPDALLYGSHGAERTGRHSRTDPAVVGTISSQLRSLVPRWPGTHVEEKPLGAALHYRRAPGAHTLTNDVADAARSIASGLAGVVVRIGSMVVELTASSDNKGHALRDAKQRAGTTHTLFIGDDITDEDAFATLSEQDLGVKVGHGETVADARIDGIADVAELLEHVGQLRRSWLDERRLVPLQNHSLLSDHRTLAVIDPNASVNWLCLPRADSPAIFAELLGGPDAGSFAVQPLDHPGPPEQSYLPATMVLRSRWAGGSDAGGLDLHDYLDLSDGRATQRAGRTDLVRTLTGRGKVQVTFKPRLDFGRYDTRLRVHHHGDAVEIPEAPEPLVLVSTPTQWTLLRGPHHDTARTVIDLDSCGGSATLELRYGTADKSPARITHHARRQRTEKEWSHWADSLATPRVHTQLVQRSALMLKSLVYRPAGSILAAATTSIPEQLGGVRNWDYRFCWPRDASWAATTLARLGSPAEAMGLAEWLVGVMDTLDSPERLRPLYTVTGKPLNPEAEIGSLQGYGGSRPVRVNNAASNQVQLDVFGPVSDMLATLAESGVSVSPDYWRLARSIVDAVEARWHEPDHGIWEVRGPKRHHVHSKLMCWHAVDRALVLHRAVLGRTSPSWEQLRERIAADLLSHAWNSRVNAFTAAYGHDDLDASALQLGLTGLLHHQDPRWKSTVLAVRRELLRGNPPGPVTLLRYTRDDGLPGREGGFILCACWLVESLTTLGQTDEAADILRSIADQAGPTGLFTEQFDPATGLALGNFPQAYSHLGFINACLRLQAALDPPPSAER